MPFATTLMRQLKIQHKILLLPAVASAGALLVLAASFTFGRQNVAALTRIQHDYYPSITLSRRLESTIGDVKQEVQDAVEVNDVQGLLRADSLATMVRLQLDSAEKYSEFSKVRRTRLRSDFNGYYTLAAATA